MTTARSPLPRPLAALLRTAAIVLVCAGAAAFLFRRGLGNDTWFYGTDTASHDLICVAYGWWQTHEAGETALWGPHLRAGQPLVESFAFMPWYPPNWLSKWAIDPALQQARRPDGRAGMSMEAFAGVFGDPDRSLPAAHSWQWPLHAALAAFFVAMAARTRGASLGAALIAGVIFGTAPHIITLTYAGHLAKVQAIAWLGLIAWGIEAHRGGKRAWWRSTGILGKSSGLFRVSIALAMMWFAGHPQIFGYGLALVLGFLVVQLVSSATRRSFYAREFARRRARRADAGQSNNDEMVASTTNRRAGRRFPRVYSSDLDPLLGLAAALAVIFLLMAGSFGAAFHFASNSNRSLQTTDDALVSSYPPEDLWELVLPRFAGTTIPESPGAAPVYRGRWGERIVSDYLGLPVIALALFGLLAGRVRGRWWWALVSLVGVVMGLGGYWGAPYRWLVENMPGFGLFRVPAAIMVLIPLGAALLAADGFDALLGNRRWNRAWSRPAIVPVLVLAVLGSLTVATWSPLVDATRAASSGISATPAMNAALHTARISLLATAIPTILLLLAATHATRVRRILPTPHSGDRDWVEYPNHRPHPIPARYAAVLVAVVISGLLAERASAVAPFLVARPVGELAASVVPQHEAWLSLRDEADTFDGWDRTAPPGVLQDGRESSLWPMLAAFRIPHGYHPITYAALERNMREWGYDSDRFLDATGVIVRVGRGGIRWRDNAGVSGPAADAEKLKNARIEFEMRRDANQIVAIDNDEILVPFDPAMFAGRSNAGIASPGRDSLSVLLRSPFPPDSMEERGRRRAPTRFNYALNRLMDDPRFSSIGFMIAIFAFLAGTPLLSGWLWQRRFRRTFPHAPVPTRVDLRIFPQSWTGQSPPDDPKKQ